MTDEMDVAHAKYSNTPRVEGYKFRKLEKAYLAAVKKYRDMFRGLERSVLKQWDEDAY